MRMRIDPHGWLTALLLLAAAILWRAMLPIGVEPVLRLDFSKNGNAILHLRQGRQTTATKQVHVDRLDLARNGRLRHAELGDIGYTEHYFLDLRKRFRVLATDDYRFTISSDDGYALRIDGKTLCEDPKPRELGSQSCGLRLDAGEHELELSYFQAGGQSGLALQYARQSEKRSYWFGEDSPHFRFEREAAR